MRLNMVLVSSSHGRYLAFLGGKTASCQCCTKQPLVPWAQNSCGTKPVCPLGAQMFVAPCKQAP